MAALNSDSNEAQLAFRTGGMEVWFNKVIVDVQGNTGVMATLQFQEVPGVKVEVELGESAAGSLIRIANGLEGFAKQRDAIREIRIKSLQADLAVAQADVGKKWGKEAELSRVTQDFNEVNVRLQEAGKRNRGLADPEQGGQKEAMVVAAGVNQARKSRYEENER